MSTSLEGRLSRCRLCGIAYSKSPCYPGDWAVLVRRANESVSGLGRSVRHCLQVRGVAALGPLLDGWHASVDDTTFAEVRLAHRAMSLLAWPRSTERGSDARFRCNTSRTR